LCEIHESRTLTRSNLKDCGILFQMFAEPCALPEPIFPIQSGEMIEFVAVDVDIIGGGHAGIVLFG